LRAVEHFDRQIASLKPRLRGARVVAKVKQGLADIRPLIGQEDGSPISQKSVKEIATISGNLVGVISSKSTQP